MARGSPSLLLRIRFSRFTHVFSLAVEYLGPLLGSVVFATLVGLGTSSFGRTTYVRAHYRLKEDFNLVCVKRTRNIRRVLV